MALERRCQTLADHALPPAKSSEQRTAVTGSRQTTAKTTRLQPVGILGSLVALRRDSAIDFLRPCLFLSARGAETELKTNSGCIIQPFTHHTSHNNPKLINDLNKEAPQDSCLYG
jgi:hypothetical protein